MSELVRRLGLDEPARGDVKTIGLYLFDSLLGDSAWQTLCEAEELQGQPAIELALAWPAGESRLHGPYWEAMHDGRSFLGARRDRSVAISRLVVDADYVFSPESITAPARVLFVLGADLDDRDIRAGAEVIGLLRDAERGKGAINAQVIESASLDQIESTCARFRPEIVHFVCHGRLSRTAGGQLRLRPDEAGGKEWFGAKQLLLALEGSGRLPAVAVLTGCESAATGKHMDSLAAELVKGGIPIVVGMAGKISDSVCRLFSRRFVVALNGGAPLIEALDSGRRAGLLKQEAAAADDHAWVLPSICLAPGIDSDYSPVDASQMSAVLKRVEQYDLMREPVFCGRNAISRMFDTLLDPEQPLAALIGYTTVADQLGKTRLLHEFAGRALRGGHVVVMIDDLGNDTSKLPSSPLQLAVEMLKEIGNARQRFKLGPPLGSLLLGELERASGRSAELSANAVESAQWGRLGGFLSNCEASCEASGDLTGVEGWLQPALSADLLRLIADARASEDTSVGTESRALVVLGGIGNWGTATEFLCDTLLTPNGLGDQEEQVPVLATCSLPDAAQRLNRSLQQTRALPWIRFEKLEPFEEGEDTLAYRWVLLHPRTLGENRELPAYVPNGAYSDPDYWEAVFREYIEGIPGRFEEPIFGAIVTILGDVKALLEADDEDVMAAHLEQQR